VSRGARLETPCPDCGGAISLARLATALTPWHVRCPHCRARCKPAGGALGLIVSVGVTAMVALGWLLYLVFTRPIDRTTISIGIVLLVVMLLAELLLGYVVCRGPGLALHRRGGAPPPGP
jgi:hypothetical protein